MDLAHGKFEVTVQNKLIYTVFNGSFNEHGIIAWHNSIKDIINSFDGQPFSMLINELNASGATPKALAAGNKYNEWLNQQNLIAKAMVYSSDMLRDIDTMHLPARIEQNIEFFYTIADAEEWLESQ